MIRKAVRDFFVNGMAPGLLLTAAAVPQVAQAQEIPTMEQMMAPDFTIKGISLYEQDCEITDSPLCETKRFLTQTEIPFLHSLFGNLLNCLPIRIEYQGDAARADAVTAGQTIVMYGPEFSAADYSVLFNPASMAALRQDEGRIAQIKTIIHEAVHVWQNQSKETVYNDNPYAALSDPVGDDKYLYNVLPVDGKTAFSFYGQEQQGVIMEDYFAAVYLGEDFISDNFLNVDDPKAIQNLVDMVEAQFPQAKETRLQYQTSMALAAVWQNQNRMAL